jgi:methionyl-tRNA formyltransferase
VLRTVFIGSKNDFDDMLVHWLAERSELVGAIWLDPEEWRKSLKGRFDFARRRFRRRGLRKTIDEIAFFLYYHARLGRVEERVLEERVIAPYTQEHGKQTWSGDSIQVSDVNSPEAIAWLRERKPDLAFAMCVNNYFGDELRGLFEHGVFLWHEGFTPEYRGLYSPFWAVANADFEHVGYTLLRMNDSYDAGEVFVQGRALDIDPFRDYHAYIGHKAIADSLPAVEKFLVALEAGTARPIDQTGAESNYYTYPGLSDFIRQRLMLRRLARSAVRV